MRPEGLVVRLGGHEIGRLSPTRHGARFAYGNDVQQRWAGMPLLSLSLPVKSRPYSEGLTGFWFRGLLPEGRRLEAVARAIGCGEGDYVSILGRIGWECAGAVSISADDFKLPQGTKPVPWSEGDLAEKLLSLPNYGGIDPLARVSLGGYQEKLLVVCENLVIEDGQVVEASWAEPDAATISTHIVKPQPSDRYAGIVEAEAWAMCVASHAARCARSGLLRLDGAPLSLVVERFDRVWHDGTCERVHQEDCCQAMGIDPADKYAGYDIARGSDPSHAKIARLLSAYAADPQREMAELLRQVVTNLVLGNVDAHAKNYSLLYPQLGAPEISPLYDVVPVVDIEPRATYLSMRVGGEILFDRVRREHLEAEAEDWGMDSDVASSTIDATLEGIGEGLEEARRFFPDVAAKHEPGVAARLRLLA